ncbi:MAG: FAD-dependent oxidoreductase [Chloroflexi bacterium]|jgi:formate dehydrogenase (NADP+) beta subunit|nr:FAD-dependent oxidoreductase [Chloroflexota bacterium]MBT3670325.1 FAD-dependent oxidoreductase [Chloroflexota bacterium]MBT4002611.1 FAD-dependent oxidoreductase [Chloroflexota bacterium]MBT4305513.1 FAD-dependent oxidoreductase [Chloroflexota bacterium]MBT4533124.1 FAD-dependent oxidoreductase [Chloroflexota bacterium]
MVNKRYQVTIPDIEHWRAMVKCQAACPVNTDARGYVTAMARGDLALGYEIAHDPNPMSTICGRICGAPCEVACRRGDIHDTQKSIAIRPIKRVLTERHGPESEDIVPDRDQQSGLISPDLQVIPKDENFFSAGAGLQSTELDVPGTGAKMSYSSARWSRRELKRLSNQPGHKKGKIAIIGAGPASLSVAYDLAILEHEVTIYEAGPKTGGMMRYGVPVYRFDQQAMDLEIQSILDMGVNIYFDTPIGKDITLPDLRNDYDAVFLGIGLMKGRDLNIEGHDLDGVIKAVDLLLNYNLGYKVSLGKKVIVIGGGDVAMDAARTALRLGQVSDEQANALSDSDARAEEESETVSTALDVARTALRMGVADVQMIALEDWDELPASDFEIEEALEEGIKLFPRVGPNKVVGRDGKVTGLEVIQVTSVFDEEGRFSPKFTPKTERIIDCDTVILAIGQQADLNVLGGADDVIISPRGLVDVNPETGGTSAPDVFAGGDVAYGPRLIIDAVKHGHLAALGMDEYIQEQQLTVDINTEWTELPNHVMFENWTEQQRIKPPVLPIDRRTGISVVDLGYTVEEAKEQAQRCLECSVNTVFNGKLCILCNGCVDVCPWDCLKIVSLAEIEGSDTLDQVVNVHTGVSLEAIQKGQKVGMAAMLKGDAACTRCALCADRCPTDAITMEAFRFEETLTYEK